MNSPNPLARARTLALSLVLAAMTGVPAWGHGNTGSNEMIHDSDRAIRFPNTVRHVTLVFDPHTHSVFSDGHVWPNIRVREAVLDALDALAITEHLEFQPHLNDIPHPDRNRAFEEAMAAAEGGDLMVIPGVEITRGNPYGHMNAIFITDANALFKIDNPPEDPTDFAAYFQAADRSWPPEAAVKAAREQGAFVFWNHPYWTFLEPSGIASIKQEHIDLIKAGDLHGIEVANGRDFSEEAFAIALEHDLVLIGCSDVHNLIDWDYQPDTEGGHRPVTLVFAEKHSPQALREAMFAKRTAVWFKNLLIAREREMRPLLDASLEAKTGDIVPNTGIYSVELTNYSDARFMLRNITDYTFAENHDVVEVAPHSTETVQIKGACGEKTIELAFEVENALVAPKTHPTIRREVRLRGKCTTETQF